MALYMIPV